MKARLLDDDELRAAYAQRVKDLIAAEKKGR